MGVGQLSFQGNRGRKLKMYLEPVLSGELIRCSLSGNGLIGISRVTTPAGRLAFLFYE